MNTATWLQSTPAVALIDYYLHSAQHGLPKQRAEANEATAQRWQTVAQVPDEVFEEHVATVQQEQRELTSAGLLRLAGEIKQAAETIAPQWKTPALDCASG